MILIADSGSTKTTWVGVEHAKEVFRKDRGGLNPVIQSHDEIEREVEQLAMNVACEGCVVEAIYFYGAGCNAMFVGVMEELLKRYFGENVKMEVNSDLLGAARAVCGNTDGVACILGTGSNSCLFLNGEIVQNTPALGFILGDEGSGADLGKRFLNGILKGRLPQSIRDEFLEEYELSFATIISKVYKEAMPNRFLASFAPFIKLHLHEKAVRELVVEAFVQYLQRNITPYKRADLGLGVVGSVGYHFQNELKEAADRLQLKIAKIIKAPIEELVNYHIETQKQHFCNI